MTIKIEAMKGPSFYVEKEMLADERFTRQRAESGYWRLGYKAEFPDGQTMQVQLGATDIEGTTITVHTETEARTYIGCLDRAERAAKWNREEPTDYWSHERAIEALHTLVEWAREGTSSRDLSHHGIGMPKPILVGGYPVYLRWSGMMNAIYAYEKHWDLPDIVRRPWGLGQDVGGEAREVVTRAGLIVDRSWNGDRSMVIGLEMHPSVRAAFQTNREKKRAIGEPLEGAPKLPAGWAS